jgi:hypothetical protein
MESDNEIVRQIFRILQQQQAAIRNLGANDLIIESGLAEQFSPEARVAIARNVRSTLYTLDELGDRTLALEPKAPHR